MKKAYRATGITSGHCPFSSPDVAVIGLLPIRFCAEIPSGSILRSAAKILNRFFIRKQPQVSHRFPIGFPKRLSTGNRKRSAVEFAEMRRPLQNHRHLCSGKKQMRGRNPLYHLKYLRFTMVGAEGFEPPTLCSQSRCATRLRYAPTGDEPQRPVGARLQPDCIVSCGSGARIACSKLRVKPARNLHAALHAGL